MLLARLHLMLLLDLAMAALGDMQLHTLLAKLAGVLLGA